MLNLISRAAAIFVITVNIGSSAISQNISIVTHSPRTKLESLYQRLDSCLAPNESWEKLRIKASQDSQNWSHTDRVFGDTSGLLNSLSTEILPQTVIDKVHQARFSVIDLSIEYIGQILNNKQDMVDKDMVLWPNIDFVSMVTITIDLLSSLRDILRKVLFGQDDIQ
jgi:hypothetical protein